MGNLYTVKQVAFILKVHPLSVRRYIREKKLAAIKVSGVVRIKEESLQNLQKDYSTRRVKAALIHEPAKIFSLDDPLWHLEGVGISLSSPAYES